MLCLHCISHGSVKRTKYCPGKFVNFPFYLLPESKDAKPNFHVYWVNRCIYFLFKFKLKLDSLVPLPLLLWLWEVVPASENTGSGAVFLFFFFPRRCICMSPSSTVEEEGGAKERYCHLNRREMFSCGLFMIFFFLINLASLWYWLVNISDIIKMKMWLFVHFRDPKPA